MIARVIAARIARFHTSERIERRLAFLDAKEKALARQRLAVQRVPHYCSGCPHNTSTTVPEGSRALAGIGCHYMATWMDRRTETFTQMGGEGVPGSARRRSPRRAHVFANLGDGTYFHSGMLAIRAAVAAGVNITYKILYNDAVAMTGGQPVDGRSVPQIAQCGAEGVQRIVVVTDEPEKYPIARLRRRRPASVRTATSWTRSSASCASPGVTVADLRPDLRRREAPPAQARQDSPIRRSASSSTSWSARAAATARHKSNCLSVVPVETEFGRKREIDQSSCNKDYSCLKGFCPSFVTVEGGSVRKARRSGRRGAGADLPDAARAELPGSTSPRASWSPASAAPASSPSARSSAWRRTSRARAASVLDMTGLAQKGGAVFSARPHRRRARGHPCRRASRRARPTSCSAATSSSPRAMRWPRCAPAQPRGRQQRRDVTSVVHPRARDRATFPTLPFPADMEARCVDAVGPSGRFRRRHRLATALLGDSIATNLFMLGYA